MGLPRQEVIAALEAMRQRDLPTHGGRTLAYVYDSGLAEADAVGREALAMFAGANGLDPTAFPSLLRMELDLVATARRLLDGPESVVGSVTSGGTESILLAVQTARDARPEVERPSMVLPSTAHAAFHKAAHYFGVEARTVPSGPDFRADVSAMTAAVDDSTVLVVASAPSYAHGVVDPVPELAALAAARGLDVERATLYDDLVLFWLNEAARSQLEELMERGRYEYQSEIVRRHVAQGREVGREEGRTETKAQDVLTVLEARGFAVSEELRRRILECTDLATLDGWLRRAVVIADVSKLIHEH